MKEFCPYCMDKTECKKSIVIDKLEVKGYQVKVKSLVLICLNCKKDFTDYHENQDTVNDAFLEYLKLYFKYKYNKNLDDISNLIFHGDYSIKAICSSPYVKKIVTFSFNGNDTVYAEGDSIANFLHFNKHRLASLGNKKA